MELRKKEKEIKRPDRALIEQFYAVSSATASATLRGMGIRKTFIQGPLPRLPGAKVVGSAITLQFMPQREDIGSGEGQEKAEKVSALWQVLEYIDPGDIIVVEAKGDLRTGCFGEMLLTYLKTRGGIGAVVDGCIRDYPKVRNFNLPLWTVGFTPNYASQEDLFPWDFNVPIACGGCLVMPGDIIIADDDGVVVVPPKMAPKILESTLAREEQEVFERMMLEKGGALRKYYPLNEEGMKEFQAWKEANQKEAERGKKS